MRLETSGDALSRGGNTAGKVTTICVRRASVYRTGEQLTRSPEVYVEASSHAPGGTHTISVHFVALMSGFDLRIIQMWASTGEYFVKLEWIFPQHNSEYPKLTTRHLLTPEEIAPDVSFSGGLEWAENLRKHVQSLQNAAPFSSPHNQHQGGCLSPGRGFGFTPSRTLSEPLPQHRFHAFGNENYHPSQNSLIESRSDHGSSRSDYGTPSPLPWNSVDTQDDQNSTLSESIYGESTYTDSVSTPSSFDIDATFRPTPPPLSDFSDINTRQSSPAREYSNINDEWMPSPFPQEHQQQAFSGLQCEDATGEWRMNDLIQRQMQIESFEEQKRAAEALHAYNGDTSGLLALLASTSAGHLGGGWQSSGLPWF
ncbi:hypothetical protein B0T17DRAFT_179121 [Bombardia bombarda]|uniref:Uncharacterized protein n=1 Tax=Bombardia bombarda TaxID=252184 RepID=A0AA40C877_9PEZI|nr:hypothetical protein B0T17DRAFT_179121 [Bombardia bombarda]